jgi:hypothetical protein
MLVNIQDLQPGMIIRDEKQTYHNLSVKSVGPHPLPQYANSWIQVRFNNPHIANHWNIFPIDSKFEVVDSKFECML